MKKHIKRYMIAVVTLLILVLIGYMYMNNRVSEMVTVSYDNKKFDLKELELREEPFKVFFEDYSKIPMIPVNTNMLIDFHELEVDKIEVLDYLLDEQGHLRYTEKEIVSLPVEGINDDYFLKLSPHPAMYLSSAMETHVYRGIEMVITSANSAQSYLFVFQTETGFEFTESNGVTSEDTEEELSLPYALAIDSIIGVDPALNHDMTYIAVNFDNMENMTEAIQDSIEIYLSKYQVPIINESYATLVEKNMLIDDDFIKGILIDFDSIVYVSDDELIIEASKFKSGLGAVGVEIILKKVDDVWSVISAKITWIS